MKPDPLSEAELREKAFAFLDETTAEIEHVKTKVFLKPAAISHLCRYLEGHPPVRTLTYEAMERRARALVDEWWNR